MAHRYARAVRRVVLALSALVVILPSCGCGSSSTSSGGRTARTSPAPAHAPGATQSAPTRTPGAGRPGRTAIPILMYHVIASPPPGAPFPGLYVAPEEFAAQIQALKSAGWHAVTLNQVEAFWRRGTPLPAGKPIVLTFDNGYRSQYTQALPVLQRLGWVADENIQLSGLPPSQGGLTREQVRAMVAAGWELDTQGFSHADLIAIDASELRYEVAVARNTLQQRYHVPVNWFCYPSGHYDARVIAEVRAAGYRGSTTVVPGWAHPGDDPYRLHRLRVLGDTSPAQLLSQIAAQRSAPAAPPAYSGG
jgi:peptidoglycan/xylan/chitin deacetylase (PgdA/CDA1 family)